MPGDELDATAREMAEKIAATPTVAVKLARRVIGHLARPAIRASMDDELIYQTFLNRSDDFAEFRASARRGSPAALHGELTDDRLGDTPNTTRCRDFLRRRQSARRHCARARSTASPCSSPAAAPASARRSPPSSPGSARRS